MNTEPSKKQLERDKEISRGTVKGLLQTGIFMLVFIIIYFLCAGRFNLIMAWVYMFVTLVNTSISIQIVDPGLIAERSGFKEGTKRWDIIPAIIMGRIGPLAILVVAGLDVRYGWSPEIYISAQIMMLGIAVVGLIITDWAVIANRFFSGVVRIQEDRNHKVVTNGPYRLVRHPGYLGAIMFNLTTPLILNSWWAFIPAVVVIGVTIIRTALEDRTLRKELKGYEDYAKEVRYRLFPGIW